MKRENSIRTAIAHSALALMLLASLLAGCEPDHPAKVEPAGYSGPDFSGVWRGTVVEATTGNFGETVLTVQQKDEALNGTWSAWFESGSVNGGQLSGTVVASSSSADLKLDSAICPMSATVIIQEDFATGNYATDTTSCPVLLTGTMEVYQDAPYGPRYNPAVPNAPVASVTAGNGKVDLSWGHVSGASGYNVYWGIIPGVTPSTGTRIERIATPFSHGNLTNGVTYYYVVTATNLSGESAPSGELSAKPMLNLSVGPNANFDSGTLQGWTATGLWHLSSVRSASAPYSARYADPVSGTYNTGVTNSGTLESPAFVLGSTPSMGFDYFLANECSNGSDCGYDSLTMEISSTGGAYWSQLAKLVVSNTAFTHKTLSLSGYAGQIVLVRFKFSTGDALYNGYEGAYVDNISF